MGITDDGVRLTLRLPQKLRNRLGRIAAKHRRSLNSEIISMLEYESDAFRVSEPSPLYHDSKTMLESACKQLSNDEAEAILQVIKLFRELER